MKGHDIGSYKRVYLAYGSKGFNIMWTNICHSSLASLFLNFKIEKKTKKQVDNNKIFEVGAYEIPTKLHPINTKLTSNPIILKFHEQYWYKIL